MMYLPIRRTAGPAAAAGSAGVGGVWTGIIRIVASGSKAGVAGGCADSGGVGGGDIGCAGTRRMVASTSVGSQPGGVTGGAGVAGGAGEAGGLAGIRRIVGSTTP